MGEAKPGTRCARLQIVAAALLTLARVAWAS